MKWMFVFILIIGLLEQSIAASQIRMGADYFQMDDKKKNLVVFKQASLIQFQDDQNYTVDSALVDEKKIEVMTEKLKVVNGEISQHFVEQKQTQESWKTDVIENKVKIFRTYLEKDKLKTEIKEFDKPLVLVNGPYMNTFIKKNWKVLSDNKIIEFDFLVLELLKPIRFTIQKMEMKKDSVGKDLMVIKMVPNNFFIKQLVDPLYFQFSQQSQMITYFKGRTPVKIKLKNSFEPFDAEINYYKND